MSWTRTHKWLFFAIMAVLGAVLDVLTKWWAMSALDLGHQVPVLGNLLSVVLVYNKGAIFGLDPRRLMPNLPVNLIFYIFSAIAMVIVVVYYRALAHRDMLARWGLALVMPGALGNLFDRVVHPQLGVVDFIMVDLGVWPADPWPVFNLADIYLTVGVLLILGGVVREEWDRSKLAKQSSSPTSTPAGDEHTPSSTANEPRMQNPNTTPDA